MPSFEYVLPAIRGIQAGREYYVSMCPLRFLPKLFPPETEEVPPQVRSQRRLNQNRVPQIARYILENPKSYTSSAIAASIDADVTFEPVGSKAEEFKLGRLRVPMDAKMAIADGQHRRAAFELALKQNPDLGYETIALILYLDIGLNHAQQMFADLNRYAIRPSPSLNILYDKRDRKAELARLVVERVRVFRTLTEMERTSLPLRSGKLFSLSSIYQATLALLGESVGEDVEEQVKLAVRFWEAVSRHILDWELVWAKKAIASEIRQDRIHSQAVTLLALGKAGAVLLSIYPDTWEEMLANLAEIDWSRSNEEWLGRIFFGGGISKTQTSVSLMTAYFKHCLGLPLTPDEERLENSRFSRSPTEN